MPSCRIKASRNTCPKAWVASLQTFQLISYSQFNRKSANLCVTLRDTRANCSTTYAAVCSLQCNIQLPSPCSLFFARCENICLKKCTKYVKGAAENMWKSVCYWTRIIMQYFEWKNKIKLGVLFVALPTADLHVRNLHNKPTCEIILKFLINNSNRPKQLAWNVFTKWATNWKRYL